MDWLHECIGATLARLVIIFGLSHRNKEIFKIRQDITYQQIVLEVVKDSDLRLDDEELPTFICHICQNIFRSRVYLLYFN